jgi:hypothetical protein
MDSPNTAYWIPWRTERQYSTPYGGVKQSFIRAFAADQEHWQACPRMNRWESPIHPGTECIGPAGPWDVVIVGLATEKGLTLLKRGDVTQPNERQAGSPPPTSRAH